MVFLVDWLEEGKRRRNWGYIQEAQCAHLPSLVTSALASHFGHLRTSGILAEILRWCFAACPFRLAPSRNKELIGYGTNKQNRFISRARIGKWGVWCLICLSQTNTIGHADRESTCVLGVGDRTSCHEYSTCLRIIQALDMMMIFYLYDDLPLGNVYHGHQYHIAAFEECRATILENNETRPTVLMWFVSTLWWSWNLQGLFLFFISSSTSHLISSHLISSHHG